MTLLINKDREFYSYKGRNNIQENEIKVLNFLEKNLDLNWSFFLNPYFNINALGHLFSNCLLVTDQARGLFIHCIFFVRYLDCF